MRDCPAVSYRVRLMVCSTGNTQRIAVVDMFDSVENTAFLGPDFATNRPTFVLRAAQYRGAARIAKHVALSCVQVNCTEESYL